MSFSPTYLSSNYVVYYIDYDNKNPLLSLLLTYFGNSNVVIFPASSITTSTCFPKMNTYICKECGEMKEYCECAKDKSCKNPKGFDNFFKMEIVNEDFFLYQKAMLHYSSLFQPSKLGFIFFKSTTTTTQPSFDQLSIIVNENFNADLFYLAKWLDKKETMNTLKVYPTSLKYIRTYNPIGIQALLFSNAGIEKLRKIKDAVCRPFSLVLLNLIKENELVAHSTFPALFNFDCMMTEYKINFGDKALYDYLKNCEIQGSIHPEEPLNRRFSSDVIFFWIFIVILIIVITLWIKAS